MEETCNEQPMAAPKHEPLFNETFGYVVVTTTIVCTYTIINLVALIA